MANYIIRDCLDTNQTYVITATTTFVTGDVITYDIGEFQKCGTIIEETTNNYDYVQVGAATDCCSCFDKTNLDDTYSFEFIDCISGNSFYLDIATFCSNYGSSPSIDEVFKIYNTGTSETICVSYVGGSLNTPNYDLIYSGGPIIDCFSCLNPPRSANTETFLCQEICVSGGTTTISVVPPHPVWTDGYGVQVTQLNMITLGGPDGLNN